jgi:hypothetical protein
MRSKITRSMLIAAAAASLLGLYAAPASGETSTPSCRYQGCTGLDPATAGCASEETTRPVASFWSGDTLVELRYSSVCEAAWARASGPVESLRCDGWTDRNVIRVEGADWRGPGTASFDGCSTSSDQVWTAMVGFDYNVRACFVRQQVEESGLTDVSQSCTAWR